MPITQINTNQYISVATSFGDVKHGFQSSDHNGWIKLDGRLISTLSANQQTQATTLGFTVNLPDATDKYLSQVGDGLLGDTSGNSNNEITIQRSNLPNVALTGTTSSDGIHTHGIGGGGGILIVFSGGGPGFVGGSNYTSTRTIPTPDNAGAHTHTITTSSINGNVVQQVTNIKPHTLKANAFVYLGL